MRVFFKFLEIGDEEGFILEKDIFKCVVLGVGMINLVLNVEDFLVIVFDGVWGLGKLIFLKMWVGEFWRVGYLVIYFDVFENDYVDDVFVVFVRELLELVEESKFVLK